MIRNKNRASAGILAALVAVLFSGCGVHGLHVQQSPLLKYFVPKSGHIAFIGVDGNIHIASQSGSIINVTRDGQTGSSATLTYAAPTWSFDGKTIVFSQFKVDPANKTERTTVFTADVAGKDVSDVFSSTKIAPFYFYWAPGDKAIGMLSQILDSQGGVEMGILPVTRGSSVNSYRPVNTGAPFYWVWGPDGREIVAHTQTGTAQNAPDFVRVIQITGTAAGGSASGGGTPAASKADTLKASLGAFDTPAIAHDGKDVVIPVGTADASDLVMRSLRTGKDRTIAKALGSVSYVVSPDGKWLAYIDKAESKGGSSRILHVVNMVNPDDSFTAKERPVLSFYCSPDSREIAYVVPPQSKPAVDSIFANSGKSAYAQLQVLNVAKRDSWSVSQFPVTQGFLNSVPFNDQYQHSSTIWSPNSRYLVFSAYDAQGNPGIFVVDANGNIKPDRIAEGEFPTWSWK